MHDIDCAVQNNTHNYYIKLLQECKALADGKKVHAHIINGMCNPNRSLGNTILYMYVKCSSLSDAKKLFDLLPIPNVFSWTMMARGYIINGYAKEGIIIFQEMQQDGKRVDKITLCHILKACSSIAELGKGKWVHACLLASEFHSISLIKTTIINMYISCGHIKGAREVFERTGIQSVVSWNAIIAGYVGNADHKEAVNLIGQMCLRGIKPDKFNFIAILGACANARAAVNGTCVHVIIIKSGFEGEILIGNTLLDMYGKCGNTEIVCWLFQRMHEHDIASWNAVINAYAQNGRGKEALGLFKIMGQEGIKPNDITFSTIIYACASMLAFEQGKRLHFEVMQNGFESNICVSTALVDMYAKCGSIENARHLFESMVRRDIVSWNVMIGAYAKHGNYEEAFRISAQMHQEGIKPDAFTFTTMLGGCKGIGNLQHGKLVHAQIIKAGCYGNVYVGNTIIDMYSSCGCMESACRVFEHMPMKDVVSWNSMLAGYDQNGNFKQALQLFKIMQNSCIVPNMLTFLSVLNACTSLADLGEGEEVHKYIVNSRIEACTLVSNKLLDMYAECRQIALAMQIFDKMSARDVGTWNAIIAGYVKAGDDVKALKLYDEMQESGVKPDVNILITIFNACTNSLDIEKGKLCHAQFIQTRDLSIFVETAILYMYAKCGSISITCEEFVRMPVRSIVTWNAMLTVCYDSKDVLELYMQMQKEGVEPDCITFTCLLRACARKEHGKCLHACLIKSNCESDAHLESSLIDMYSKCGSIQEASWVFNTLPTEDMITWTTMMAAYVRHEMSKEALSLYFHMQEKRVKPDKVTLLSVVSACSGLTGLRHGKQVHASILNLGYESDISIANALLDMYAKCGATERLSPVFSKIVSPNRITFTTIISGHAQHGCGMKALWFFRKMQEGGISPDNITLISLLSAFSHAGLIHEGCHYFLVMNCNFDVTPIEKHYTCIIDLLGRAGHVNEAKDLIDAMPFGSNDSLWIALLDAYAAHRSTISVAESLPL